MRVDLEFKGLLSFSYVRHDHQSSARAKRESSRTTEKLRRLEKKKRFARRDIKVIAYNLRSSMGAARVML